MKKYGYDSVSKSLFSWNGDFVFEGRTNTPPEGNFIVPEERKKRYEMLGCYFLSGYRRDAVVYRFDGDDVTHMAGICVAGGYAVGEIAADVAQNIVSAGRWPVCVCGPDCQNPQMISAICRRFPVSSIYVCPLVDELAAFGFLVSELIGKEKPRRAHLCSPNVVESQYVIDEFDPKLPGDGMGRMAHCLKCGKPAMNDMMKCPGISPFYGKILLRKGIFNFIIKTDAVDGYFPTEPVSIKNYAATSVPVEVKNTDKFSKVSGCASETVAILTASDYIPDLPAFMSFHHLMSKKDFVATANPADFKKIVPIFAYNGLTRGIKNAC